MLACALGSALLSVIVGYFAAKLASNFSYTIREKVFHQVTDWFCIAVGFLLRFSLIQ